MPCPWAPAEDELYRNYHDTEWGAPVRDPRALWEKLQLDGMQAGLAWITILRKRESIRDEFDGFDIESIASWDERRIAKAMLNPGIIRSNAKIRAIIGNAQAYMIMAEAGKDFSDWLWSYVDGKPVINAVQTLSDMPASTPLSRQIAKDLKSHGFKFCGPVIVYAFMQAVGMVNDHEVRCPRHAQIAAMSD